METFVKIGADKAFRGERILCTNPVSATYRERLASLFDQPLFLPFTALY